MGNKHSIPEGQEDTAQVVDKSSSSPHDSPTKFAPSFIKNESPEKLGKIGGFDKKAYNSYSNTTEIEVDAKIEASEIKMSKIEHPHPNLHLTVQPNYKVYAGMPEDVKKIVEEIRAKDTITNNEPEDGFNTPLVSTSLNIPFATMTPKKGDTFFKYDKEAETPEPSPLSPPKHGFIESIKKVFKGKGKSQHDSSPESEKHDISSHPQEISGVDKLNVLRDEPLCRGFEGETKDGKPHGKGFFTNSDGSKLEGDWFEGKLTGSGKKTLKNGETSYIGAFKESKYHGYGEMNNTNLTMAEIAKSLDPKDLSNLENVWISYKGEFDDDKKHGHGVMLFRTMEKFEGTFAHDKITGSGVFYTNSGEAIKGEWKNGLFQENK